jgi:hypothetical protein
VHRFPAAALAAALLLIQALPAAAQTTSGAGGSGSDRDEKLPAQLPSVTIQGEDLSTQGRNATGRVAPTGTTSGSTVRLPDPTQRRATSEDNRALMVGVTPTTVEPPAALPGSRLPYTAVVGGWGPLTQYRAGLYDARMWGPALGITEVDGRAGWGWSGWRAKEWLDWAGVGRLGAGGEGFAWEAPGAAGPLRGGQNALAIDAEYGGLADFTGGVSYERGLASAAALPDLNVARTALRGQWKPAAGPDHQPKIEGTAQHRVWGRQAGPEAYVRASDFWSLSDVVQLEGSLGGGYWGREAIVDPGLTFHYRPAPSSHLFAGLKTASELPDFETLYLRRPATAPYDDLQAERVEGWATAGASHRLTEQVWGRLAVDLRRSWRHVYWTDLDADGLWQPTNAAGEQWGPQAEGRLQVQWLPTLQQDFRYRWAGVFPLGVTEQRLGTILEGEIAGPGASPVSVSIGAEGRLASLSSQQVLGGASATGVFAEADIRYALTRDFSLGLTVADVPLALAQTQARNYFAPAPLLTVQAQYQF